MTCYVVGQLKIEDPETYKKYMAGFVEMFTEYDGKVIAVDDDPTIVEGEWDYTRFALIKFPSKAEAERWYNSDKYQEITRNFRRPSSHGPLLFVESSNRKI